VDSPVRQTPPSVILPALAFAPFASAVPQEKGSTALVVLSSAVAAAAVAAGLPGIWVVSSIFPVYWDMKGDWCYRAVVLYGNLVAGGKCVVHRYAPMTHYLRGPVRTCEGYRCYLEVALALGNFWCSHNSAGGSG